MGIAEAGKGKDEGGAAGDRRREGSFWLRLGACMAAAGVVLFALGVPPGASYCCGYGSFLVGLGLAMGGAPRALNHPEADDVDEPKEAA